MATTNFKGNPVNLKGDLPTEGSEAPDFKFVKSDMSEGKLSDHSGETRVLISVPSLDTPVCANETKQFNQKLSSLGARGIVISQDLPFAMKRFCETEGVEKVEPASDFRYGEFNDKYGVEMTDGPLNSLSARAVFVVTPNNKIAHIQLVPEIGEEPDYDKVLEHVKELA